MSNVLYYEPPSLYLDGVFSTARAGIPGGFPATAGFPSAMNPGAMSSGAIPGGGIPMMGGFLGGIPMTASQKPIDIVAALKSLKPTMDLHEDTQQNVVTATFEFPGVSKEDVQIDLHAGKLIVSAETKHSEEHAQHDYAVRERRFGKFSRTLQLPQGIKEEEIKASMENGVLTVTFPKLTPELAPKRISIA